MLIIALFISISTLCKTSNGESWARNISSLVLEKRTFTQSSSKAPKISVEALEVFTKHVFPIDNGSWKEVKYNDIDGNYEAIAKELDVKRIVIYIINAVYPILEDAANIGKGSTEFKEEVALLRSKVAEAAKKIAGHIENRRNADDELKLASLMSRYFDTKEDDARHRPLISEAYATEYLIRSKLGLPQAPFDDDLQTALYSSDLAPMFHYLFQHITSPSMPQGVWYGVSWSSQDRASLDQMCTQSALAKESLQGTVEVCEKFHKIITQTMQLLMDESGNLPRSIAALQAGSFALRLYEPLVGYVERLKAENSSDKFRIRRYGNKAESLRKNALELANCSTLQKLPIKVEGAIEPGIVLQPHVTLGQKMNGSENTKLNGLFTAIENLENKFKGANPENIASIADAFTVKDPKGNPKKVVVNLNKIKGIGVHIYDAIVSDLSENRHNVFHGPDRDKNSATVEIEGFVAAHLLWKIYWVVYMPIREKLHKALKAKTLDVVLKERNIAYSKGMPRLVEKILECS
ncbi:hypothetical protein DdX_10579 [Ditylenchus destructor]|uniref:Uncharacterized protein n=1 Tax=Ditylenchus destructor TaxID=166010 RepID=A0AAD4R1X8_9BILA|nr:hypothetical protein DdX_10579 [Ditylenchus destructor]